jgi:hypothetical protein
VIRLDHPHTDPGDGRTECDVCGKWVFEAIHSCKGVPVTDAAWERHRARTEISDRIRQISRTLDPVERDRMYADLERDMAPAADHHARLAADPFEHADGAPCSDPWCEDKTKPGPVCDGPWTCPGINVCDRTDCDRARLAAGTEEG